MYHTNARFRKQGEASIAAEHTGLFLNLSLSLFCKSETEENKVLISKNLSSPTINNLLQKYQTINNV